jgi:hypothetical protein
VSPLRRSAHSGTEICCRREEAVVSGPFVAVWAGILAAWSLFAFGASAAPIEFTNGHYDEYVPAEHSSWTDANAAASSLSYAGLPGHLATVTSPEENAFVTDLLPLVIAAGNEVTQEAYLGGVQIDTIGSPTEGWSWLTGEPWS